MPKWVKYQYDAWEGFCKIASDWLSAGQNITVTSQWAQYRLKSPAPPLFTQPFSQTQFKENIKAPRHWPLCGNSPWTGEFPAQMASNAENVSIWWRHHDFHVKIHVILVYNKALQRILTIGCRPPVSQLATIFESSCYLTLVSIWT